MLCLVLLGVHCGLLLQGVSSPLKPHSHPLRPSRNTAPPLQKKKQQKLVDNSELGGRRCTISIRKMGVAVSRMEVTRTGKS